MNNFDFSPYKGLYLKTAREYIVKIQQSIDDLTKNPDNQDAIMALYISAHSLGSQSTLTKFISIESVCVVIEHIFQKIKGGKLKISDELLEALKNALTGLTKCLDSIDKEDKEIDLTSIKNSLEVF